MPHVSQTGVIFFALLIGFIVFITVRGELQGYLHVIGLGGGANSAQGIVNQLKSGIPLTPGQIIDLGLGGRGQVSVPR